MLQNAEPKGANFLLRQENQSPSAIQDKLIVRSGEARQEPQAGGDFFVIRDKLGRFQKGFIPWNKGKSKISLPNCKICGKKLKDCRSIKCQSCSKKGNQYGKFNKGKHLWKDRPHPRGMLGKTAWNKGKPWSKKTRKKLSNSLKGRFGEKSSHWKGGKIKHQRGYIYIYKPDHPFATKSGYVFEHRLIIEKQIGRYLHKWEISHHINKIKTDNCIKNLMLFKNQKTHKKFETNKPINPTDIVFSGKK